MYVGVHRNTKTHAYFKSINQTYKKKIIIIIIKGYKYLDCSDYVNGNTLV